MQFTKVRSLLLAVIIGLATVLISLGTLGMMSPVLALERAGTEPAGLEPLAQPPPPEDDFHWGVVFTDPAVIDIQDLSGNVIGEGEHTGEVRCKGYQCSHKTQLQFTPFFTDPAEYEYKFTTRQALDPVDERVVVSGKGTISSRGQKKRFFFTATFQNNRDGTVWVSYVASRPDASFRIPKAPGTMTFRQR